MDFILSNTNTQTSTNDRYLTLFRMMCLIREFEERAAEEKTKGSVPGLVHQSTGQEAVPTGICAHLKPADYLFSTHRGHGHALAKGADPIAMMKEIFGKEDNPPNNSSTSSSIDLSDFVEGNYYISHTSLTHHLFN